MIYRELANPLVDLHRRLLQDSVRVKSFGRAIRETVKEGDIVLDIGTGTGIMAMLAAKAGAKKVYAIERTSAIEFGKELARENGLLGSIEFIKGDVVDAGQLEKADVIISECLESPGPSGMMVSVLNARNRWLKSRGRIIPESFRTFFVPVQSETLYREANMPYYRGLDLSVLQDVACNLAFVADLRKGDFLSSAKSLPMFSLRASNKVSISGTLNFRVNANCLLHGFGAWFESQLSPAVKVSAAPGFPATVWHQAFLPFQTPLRLRKGESLKMQALIETVASDIVFHIKAQSLGGCRFHSTFKTIPSVRKLIKKN